LKEEILSKQQTSSNQYAQELAIYKEELEREA